MFEITEQQRNDLYEEIRRITPNGDLYFPDHVRPVARNCFVYSNYLFKKGHATSPVICELGGLLHDIGYTKFYESNESDHIKRGVEMAPQILKKFGINGDFLERIVDCIWTHDGNLNRSQISKSTIPPLDNIIVNDIDAMQFFDCPIPSLMEFSLRLIPNRSDFEVAKGLIEHAKHTYSLIYHDFFKDLANPKYEALVKNLGGIMWK